MKKSAKIAVALCTLSALAVGTLAGCSSKVNIIEDPNPYTFENKGHPVAEYDAGYNIDGKLDEARWHSEEQRWLYGMDKINDNQYAEIEFTAFYGEKGIFFGLKVEEHGNRIWVNNIPSRVSGHINSAVDMYLGPVGVEDGGSKTFEFSFVADGTYASRVNYNGLVEVLATYDKLPVVATTTLGGEVNTEECYGYVIEAFFPYTFLEFAGWELPEDKSEMTVGINPAHIFSFNYTGTDTEGDRYWSNWAPNYGIAAGWLYPDSYFYFGENGLKSYDYKITYGGSGKGTVTEKNDMPYVLAQAQAIFIVKAKNGADITKLTVNGEDYRNKLKYSGSTATFTIDNPSEDLDIQIDFN